MRGECLPAFSLDSSPKAEPREAVFQIEKSPAINKRNIAKVEKQSEANHD